MSIIPVDASKGEDIYDGTTTMYTIDNSGDPMSGGSYSHNPKLCSATALAQYRDFIAYVKTLELDQLPAHIDLGVTAHGGIVASTDSRLTNARTPSPHALVDNTGHTTSGLTAGQVLTALTATTVGFVASGSEVPLANLTGAGIVSSEVVGESVVFGQALYRKSDGKWWIASNAAASTMPAVRIALATASANASCSMLKSGRIRNDSLTLTVGGPVYVTTAGGLTQTAPTASGSQLQIIGFAHTATVIEIVANLVTAQVL